MLPKEFDPHAMPVYLPEISDTESATDCTGTIAFLQICNRNAEPTSQFNFKELFFGFIIQLIIVLCGLFQLIFFTLSKAKEIIQVGFRSYISIQLRMQIPLCDFFL